MGQQQQKPPRIVEPRIPLHPFVAYMIGLALGGIPTALILLAMGEVASQVSSTLMTLALVTYFIVVVPAIACPLDPRTRFVGYGLLTMVFVTPVVWHISCVASCTGRYCPH
ncbi:MAG TPA: hypothetical protein VGN34_32805 [Ktedonobacteraceae bacterium]|jgi:hypothetical protein